MFGRGEMLILLKKDVDMLTKRFFLESFSDRETQGECSSQGKGPMTQSDFEAKEGFLDMMTATVRLRG